ncbi:polyprenyl synthetase family protein [Pararhodospirillum photometricum]|nr:polyprenyl synthetase family protein [Pararhodospirillum photometricum]
MDAALDALMRVVGDDLTRVNQSIVARMDSPVGLIPQLGGYIIAAGGKRLRPLLTLAAARLCGFEGERHAHLAACVEFIHTATLLHDDVVDESMLRRGRDSANAVWGNKASVLVGDFLFARSFQLMVEDGSLKVLAILSHATSVLAEGEVLQLVTANDTSTTEDAYMAVIRAKTAQLFAAACQVGAVVAERPEVEEQALHDYGMNLGIAFQLVDDYLDYSAKQQDLGKTVGDDFMDGKITLPVILAYARGTEEERAFLRRCLEDQEMPEFQADLARAMEMMTRYDTLSETITRARAYGEKARQALSVFPDSEAKSALVGIVDFCIDRAY